MEHIYYFAYRHDRPTGGQKDTYRHVDILNRNGMHAAVFHPGDAFRISWFANTTQIVTYDEFRSRYDPRHDFLVVPEDLGSKITVLPGKKIIFNKNLFYGFRAFGPVAELHYPYSDPEVVAAFAVSEHNRSHLQFAYPNLRVERVLVDIDPSLFYAPLLANKKPIIACIPKCLELVYSVFHTLMSRARAGLNRADRFRWIFLGDKTETEVAATLRDAVVFVFLSSTEGMARMPLEAQACGCLVAGYDAGPNAEFLPTYSRFPSHDIIGLVSFLERVIDSYPDQMHVWNSYVAEGIALAKLYSPERQEDQLVRLWKDIVGHA